jgi:ABC-type transport system involved in cytochrome c biogenesis permease subunit
MYPDRVTVFCFVASYAVALSLEVAHLLGGRAWSRVLAVVAGAAGLVAHTIFLYVQQPPLIWLFGWMLFVAWALAVFYVFGAVHHLRLSWGIFVLPLILALVGIGVLYGRPDEKGVVQGTDLGGLWGPVHGFLLLLATVGVCVGFLASVMYLIQAHRLRTKAPPGQGLRLLSLERLETMNRRALVVAFPLLTAGMIAGLVPLIRGSVVSWLDGRVIVTAMSWVVFAVLLYLRFARHLRGRRVAILTIVAFFLLLGCMAVPHGRPAGGQ